MMRAASPPNGAVPSSATRNGFEVHDNAIALGVRYAFGAP
jgi:hypothetical protein